ncbi:MAG TPA: hypothetical protein VHD81_00320 [Mycobacteriales bacterium]|nr:hypothetical protein [Mycobacteriales bacterium]
MSDVSDVDPTEGPSLGPDSAAPSVPDETSGLIARLIDDSGLDKRSRATLLRRLAVAISSSARQAGAAAVASGQWLAELVAETAPHIPIRDLETLSRHHDGKTGDALAGALIENAARATGAVGAAAGLVASVEWTTPPALLAAPVQVAAETLAVIAIEVKLVAELHAAYGRPASGTPAMRMASYLGAWTRRRALDRISPGEKVSGLVTGAARRELRRRVVGRAGSSTASVLPLLAGAVAGASLNSRQTKKLGKQITAGLK